MADRKRPREEERTFQPRRLWGERARGAGLGSSRGAKLRGPVPKRASKGGNDTRDKGTNHPPPRRGTPRPQVGLGWRVREDTSSTLPTYPLHTACKRVSRHPQRRDSLGLTELHPKWFWRG